MVRLCPLALGIALFACGGGDGGGDSADAALETDAATNALPSTCTGECQDVTALVQFGDATGDFERAYYGVTSRDGTLHIEAHAGGTPGCPTENDSSSPDRTLVIGSVPAPSSAEPLDGSDGVSIALVDVSGDILTGAPVASATEEVVTPVAASLSGAEPFIAFSLSATFEGGSASGHVYATHCPSMDQ